MLRNIEELEKLKRLQEGRAHEIKEPIDFEYLKDLVKLEKPRPLFALSDRVLKQISILPMKLDNAYTMPNGWMRFIQNRLVKKFFYIQYKMPSSNGIFKFELEQNVDYWLANTKYVYCVCDVGDGIVLIQVRNDISTICIGIEKGIPVQYGHGDLNSLNSYYWFRK